jgi:hypothetical protein
LLAAFPIANSVHTPALTSPMFLLFQVVFQVIFQLFLLVLFRGYFL